MIGDLITKKLENPSYTHFSGFTSKHWFRIDKIFVNFKPGPTQNLC